MVQRIKRCNYRYIVTDRDGGYTEWTGWSQCDKSCVSGTTTRTRNCTNPTPEGDGKKCEGPAVETKVCNDFPCPCKYSGNVTCHR